MPSHANRSLLLIVVLVVCCGCDPGYRRRIYVDFNDAQFGGPTTRGTVTVSASMKDVLAIVDEVALSRGLQRESETEPLAGALRQWGATMPNEKGGGYYNFWIDVRSKNATTVEISTSLFVASRDTAFSRSIRQELVDRLTSRFGADHVRTDK